MATSLKSKVTTEAFLAWAMTRPDGEHYELFADEIVAMAPERVRHSLVKGQVYRRLQEAVEQGGLRCDVFPGGMAIRIDDNTAYEPDVAVRCGEALPDDTIAYSDPLVIVEVLSPSTTGVDTGIKLADYFRLPSLRHYQIVRTSTPTIIHHERGADGKLHTRILTSGALHLDPPGLTLDVAALFP